MAKSSGGGGRGGGGGNNLGYGTDGTASDKQRDYARGLLANADEKNPDLFLIEVYGDSWARSRMGYKSETLTKIYREYVPRIRKQVVGINRRINLSRLSKDGASRLITDLKGRKFYSSRTIKLPAEDDY